MAMDSSNQKNNSKIIIFILSLLIAALAFFAYQNYTKSKHTQEALLEDKLEIQADLDSKITELNTAISKNSVIETDLINARDNIISFRDSVKDLKTLNYKVIRRYKNKLAALEVTNKKLLRVSDSLKVANVGLAVEIDSAKAKIQRHITTIEKQIINNDSLAGINSNLSDKVLKGAKLQIGNVNTIAMRERRSGNLKKTERARRTDAFRTSFKIRSNALSESGKKKAHIVIQNAAGKVVGPIDSFIDVEGVAVNYSDVTDVEYNNADIEVIVVTEIPEDSIEKGNHTIKVYLEKKLLGIAKLTLK